MVKALARKLAEDLQKSTTEDDRFEILRPWIERLEVERAAAVKAERAMREDRDTAIQTRSELGERYLAAREEAEKLRGLLDAAWGAFHEMLARAEDLAARLGARGN